MEWLKPFLLVMNVIFAIAIIGLVLLQHGKGSEMGTAFGSGSSASLFGAAGSANFLSRCTAVTAFLFFATSLALSMLATHGGLEKSVMQAGVPLGKTVQKGSGAVGTSPTPHIPKLGIS